VIDIRNPSLRSAALRKHSTSTAEAKPPTWVMALLSGILLPSATEAPDDTVPADHGSFGHFAGA
jgi:hypothetical protein